MLQKLLLLLLLLFSSLLYNLWLYHCQVDLATDMDIPTRNIHADLAQAIANETPEPKFK